MSSEVRASTRRAHAAVLVGAACVTAASAHAYTITNDTYIDSYQYTDSNGNVLSTNQRTNYGSLGVVKVVTSAASVSFPAPSTVRTLLTLPSTFISALGTSRVSSAIITYTAKNDGSLANRVIEAHPLTATFVAGTGGSPSSTQGGGDNTAGTGPLPGGAYGADWQTSNGTTPWATAGGGGDFDAADFVNDLPVQTVTSGGSTFHVYSWDIAPLLDNPITRADVLTDGLLLKVFNDGEDPNPQQFASLYSSDGATANNSTIEQPTANFVVPEPTTVAMLGIVGMAGLARRRRRDSGEM